MPERKRKKDNSTISHGLDDELDATIEERVAAQREGDATHPTPRAPHRTRVIGNTDAPISPDEASPGGRGKKD